MNEKCFCFIICTNQPLWFSECQKYISRLYVPEGYTIELLGIEEATSMTSGYNEGMQASNARYKIYMHQDVFIINRYFLYDLLSIFQSDSQIGMIGMVGTTTLPPDGVMMHAPRVGALYIQTPITSDIRDYRYQTGDGYTEVSMIDGLMIITNKDLPWREDLFHGWDFYDASQSLEFTRQGYRIVVPNMTIPWVIHDDGIFQLNHYNHDRINFIKEYYD